MSLEQALAANTEALNRVAALLQGAAITPNVATAPVIPQPQPAAPAPTFAAPAAPTGMPPAPFPGAGVPAAPTAPAGLPARPFNDALGLLEWAKTKYEAAFAKDPKTLDRLTLILQQHGLDQVGIGAAQPPQFDSLYHAISALG